MKEPNFKISYRPEIDGLRAIAVLSVISKIYQLNFNFKKNFYINGKFTFYDQGHWSNFSKDYFGRKLIEHPYLKEIKND